MFRFPRLSTILPLVVSTILAAQTVPSTINYQGRLTDNSPQQNPLTATVYMQFEIWDVASGGTVSPNRLWIEPASGATPVAVRDGVFSVLLGGNGAPLPASLFSGGATRWLQIIAAGETLAPRQALAATAYANQAQLAAQAADSATLAGLGPAGYQQRTAGNALSCGAGLALRAVAPDGAPTCVTAASGTVTSVATGAGLSGGPITTTGTVDLRLSASGGLSKTLGAGSNELGIAAGGVAPAQLSAGGSTSGQALVSNGSAVAWGAPSVPPRKYGISPTQVQANQALTNCPAGYHMAEMLEIVNPSALLYDKFGLSLANMDVGSGPPAIMGWVRTGTQAGVVNAPGWANCNLWTSAAGTDYGTAIMPNPNWRTLDTSGITYGFPLAPWVAGAQPCNTYFPVWCIQN